MKYLVAKPAIRFSRDEAHMINDITPNTTSYISKSEYFDCLRILIIACAIHAINDIKQVRFGLEIHACSSTGRFGKVLRYSFNELDAFLRSGNILWHDISFQISVIYNMFSYYILKYIGQFEGNSLNYVLLIIRTYTF